MKQNTLFSTRNMVLIALMTAIMCILAPVSLPLPFTPVPITLAVLIVYFCAYVLDPISSLICILLYLLLGAIGLPVFANYRSGLGVIFGPTGGYLVGYLFIAYICSLVFTKFPKNILFHILAMTFSITICLILGTVWFTFRKEGVTFIQAFYLCVIPFIPGAIIKIIIAAIAGPEIAKRIRKI